MKLVLKQGDVINGLDGVQDVDLAAGRQRRLLQERVPRSPGEVTYSLEVTDAAEDRFKENNRATAVAAVLGKPVVLYVDGNPARASYLASGARARSSSTSTRATRCRRACARPSATTSSSSATCPPSASRSRSRTTIEQYVRDLGGGFLFAGGENGYGLGGWYHTTIERILPVRMDAEKRRDEPEVAMALVIDRSGSMTGLPLEMAKQAAKATADTLAADDLLEVIAFDSQPTRIVQHDRRPSTARASRATSRASRRAAAPRSSRALDAAYQALVDDARARRSTSSCSPTARRRRTASAISCRRWRPRTSPCRRSASAAASTRRCCA